MKVLLVADLHYDLRKFDWVVGAADLVDVVVMAGDHLELASMVERSAQATVALKYFRRIAAKGPLLVSSGNHDLDDVDVHGERTADWLRNIAVRGIPTDGDSWACGDTLFTICPWWDGDVSRKAIADQFERDAAVRPRRWVWVYHGPPDDSPTSWGGGKSFGDPVLNDWIDQYRPDLILSGHVHQSPFVPKGSWADRIGETWIFNAGHQIGPIPAHVALDLDGEAPRAYWLSLTGAQWAALDAPLERPLDRLTEPPAWLVPVIDLAHRQMMG